MNFEKIQMNILKSAEKRDSLKRKFNCRYGYYKDCIVVTNEQCTSLYLIPKDRFYLNIENVFRESEVMNFNAILDTSASNDIELTSMLTKSKDGHLMNVFENGDEKIYVDKRLLDVFNVEKLTYKGSNRKSPVYIYDYNEELIGLILPVNHH